MRRENLGRNFISRILTVTGTLMIISGLSRSLPAADASLTVTQTANPGVPWTATDQLQRTTTSPGKIIPGRTVGMFYFLWHDSGPEVKAPWNDGPYDIMKILARDPDALSKPDSPFWGKATGTMHYWGEPMYGYYRTDDPWVLRRHAMLLSDAGVDVVIFDTTNAVIYTPMYRALCETWSAMRREGERTPQTAFMVNTAAGETGRRIYDDLYRNGEYRDLWFQWDARPLMICDPSAADQELRDFFTLRRAHWPFTMENTDRAWHWEAAYPQPYGYVDDPSRVEQVNVSVAQNLSTEPDAKVTDMSSGNARGRSFCRAQRKPEIATDEGRNFSEQWKRVDELQPPFVMVTGWNEWIAGNWGVPDKSLKFVDQFDREYSRDIEPMKDGHGDNYYLQLVAGIRRYKGAPALPKAPAHRTIDPEGDFTQWDEVTPEFRDHTGESRPRDWSGVGGTHYRNESGRNDIVRCKFTRDAKYLYFYLETAEAFRFDGETPDGLTLLLDPRTKGRSGMGGSGRPERTSETEKDWLGVDYRITTTGDATTPFVLMRRTADGWKTTGTKISFRISGNQLHLAVPYSGRNPRFKWLDHCCVNGWNAEELYQTGDVAPESRFFHEVR
ncbi:MAG: hypothetical protein Q4C47_05405 [Planctomycetia bacterium]|nr:hypothetical protein [Planctomycetia bacterium]